MILIITHHCASQCTSLYIVAKIRGDILYLDPLLQFSCRCVFSDYELWAPMTESRHHRWRCRTNRSESPSYLCQPHFGSAVRVSENNMPQNIKSRLLRSILSMVVLSEKSYVLCMCALIMCLC